MRILTKWLSSRTAIGSAPDAQNLYPLWIARPDQVIAERPDHAAFSPAEINAARFWSARQRRWGLRADVHQNRCGSEVILEVFGPDELVPHWIVYPTEASFQVDEFSGESRVYPCLESALLAIAPLA
jgi:hypothetical protein